MTDFSHIEKQIEWQVQDATDPSVSNPRMVAVVPEDIMRQMLKVIRCISKHTMAIDFDSELEMALDKLEASDD